MRGIADCFSVSREYSEKENIKLPSGALLFHGANEEERSELSSDFKSKQPEVEIIFIDEFENETIGLHFSNGKEIFSLRSNNDSNKLTNILGAHPIYIDITGLTHNSWAWLLKAILRRKKGESFAVYTEPSEYRFHDAPLDGQIFDLSEKISGIAPLPGLARLAPLSGGNFIFMPLLGFEGARLAHIMEDVQPSRDHTFPVFGVPGFRYEYPFYAYQGNRFALEREGIWKNFRYEKANCPVSIFLLGQDLLRQYPDKVLRIATIGTKPHALGAVLLKLCQPSKIDIIYDHPIRKKGRTKGEAKTLFYKLDIFSEQISNL